MQDELWKEIVALPWDDILVFSIQISVKHAQMARTTSRYTPILALLKLILLKCNRNLSKIEHQARLEFFTSLKGKQTFSKFQ